jgi:Helix-turn-helix domain
MSRFSNTHLEKMGARIPREIRLDVIRKWLQGRSRDQIASEVRIGAGTVSAIIKEYRSGDFDADLLREVALNLKNRGLDIQRFAPLVRLREVLEDMEWILGVRPGQKEEEQNDDYDVDQVSEKKMESLIISLEVFCFKENLSAKQLFDCIHSIYLTTGKLGVSLENFPSHIEELKIHIDSLRDEIKYWESEKQSTLESYQTTEKLLKEFQMSRPMFDTNQRLKEELEQAIKDRNKYKFELESERIWKRKEEEREWSILEIELEKANRELGYRTGPYSEQELNPNNLKGLVMDVYHHPSKYAEIIIKLMERYNSEKSKADFVV